MAKKIILSSLLILVILTSSLYFIFDEKFKIDIQKTRTQYYVYENENWELAATEYVHLYDGTTKMRAKSRELLYWNDSVNVYTQRKSIWKDNITTIQTYTFDIYEEKIEKVPVKNEFECFNCQGKIVHYEIRDILYEGETKEIDSPFGFGYNMNIEWQDGAYYAKVFQQKVSDKIIIKYRPMNNSEKYSVRLFDPIDGILYDEANAKYILINKTTGSLIAELKLLTPQNNYVGRGYQEVAEIEIKNGILDYEEIIKGIELYHIGEELIPFERQVDYKIKVDVEVPKYDIVCNTVFNESNNSYDETCVQVENGTREIEQLVNFDENFLPANKKIKLSLWTTVEKGDHCEWIINMFDLGLIEWAEWTESLNADLISYWKLDESSGIVADNIVNETFDGDLINTPTWTADGKINNALAFTKASSEYVNVSDDPAWDLAGDFTINVWVWKNTTGSQIIMSHGNDLEQWSFYVTGAGEVAKLVSTTTGVTWNSATVTGTTVIGASWNMVTLRKDGTNYTMYGNGYAEASSTNSDTLNDANKPLKIGSISGPAINWNGRIDEPSIWERALTDAEIVEIYNGGDGIQYIPTVEDTCTPSSPLTANYQFECSDNCTISSAIDGGGYNITINGTGHFIMNANISNWDNLLVRGQSSSNRCNVFCFDGCFI